MCTKQLNELMKIVKSKKRSYNLSRILYMVFSVTLIGIVSILVITSTIILISSSSPELLSKYPEIMKNNANTVALAGFATSGLLLALNKFMILTVNWARYATYTSKLEAISNNLALLKAKSCEDKAALDVWIKYYLTETNKIIKDETAQWAGEITQAMLQFQEFVQKNTNKNPN